MSPALRRMQGVVAVLFKASHELQPTDDEKAAVAKVETAFLADDGNSASAATGAFMADVAAGIRAGKLETAKLTVDYANIDKASEALQAKEIIAISGLHDALSGPERQALATAVQTRRAARERVSPPSVGDASGPDWTKIRVDRLTRDLALDVDGGQQKQVAALVASNAKSDPQSASGWDARREESKKRMDGILTAFVADTMDAKTLPLTFSGMKSPHEGAEHTAAFYASLLPVLKPDQREKLAMRVQRVGGRPGHFVEDGPIVGGFEGVEDFGPMPPPGPLLR
jgi:hypothetical protein